MPQDSSGDRSLPLTAVLGLLLATGGAALYFSALTSSRPPTPSDVKVPALGYQDAEARLWQDPLKAAWDRKLELERDSATAAPAASQAVTVTLKQPTTSPTERSSECPAEPGPHDPRCLVKQIERFAPDETEAKTSRDILLLPVLIPGSAYGEDAERRLRDRIAVLAGLAVSGYQADSESHIGYVELNWDLNVRQPDTRYPPGPFQVAFGPGMDPTIVVPYEWWRPAQVRMSGPLRNLQAHYAAVLVLWISEETVADAPLARLTELIKQIKPPAGGPRGSSVKLKLAGPGVSTTLHALVTEVAAISPENRSDPRAGMFAGAAIYSPTATADDRILMPAGGHDGSPADVKSLCASRVKTGPGANAPSLHFERTTPTDRQLCEALVDELERRGLPIRRDADAPADVAVVSEWDTYYGKALPFSFAAAVLNEDPSYLIEDNSRFPDWIHPFTYPRGIDGKVPGNETGQRPSRNKRLVSGGDADSGATAGQASKFSSPAEPPEGLNQSDYLRRLADQLAQLDASLRRTKGTGLRAVGVLGTDVYDKLLILRALRDRLPGVVFFTTELDARYCVPSEWDATHNLVIASAFGLRLHQFYQHDIPPFRDSDQTALFHAVLVALSDHDPLKAPETRTLERLRSVGAVRLFEIGRSRAYDLTVDREHPATLVPFGAAAEADAGQREGSRPPPPTVHPPREDLTSAAAQVSWAWAFAGTAMLLAFLVFAFLPPRPLRQLSRLLRRAWRDKDPAARRCVRDAVESLIASTPMFLALSAVLISATLMVMSHVNPQESQPWAPFDRVSVWPTEALRLLATLLCIHFIAKAIIAGRANDREIEHEFQLHPLPARNAPHAAPGQGVLAQMWTKPTWRLTRWAVFGDRHGGRVAEPYHPAERDDSFVYAQNLWWEYLRRRTWWQRLGRAAFLSLVFLLFAFCIYQTLGTAPRPVRGTALIRFDAFCLWASVLAFVFLTFFVLDATLLETRLIAYLTRTDTRYPPKTIERFRRYALKFQDIAEYVDIRLIASRTRAVGEVVYYPFVIFFLTVVARSSLFADWKWPASLIIVLLLSLSVAIAGTLLLRYAAEQARKQAVVKLKDRLIHYTASAGDDKHSAALSQLIDLIENEREGAFSLLSEHPFVAAILLPSGSIGVWALLEYVAKYAGT